MALDLALVDLFRPYLLMGEATDWHAVLSVLYVESYETALSADGATFRGVARFSGDVEIVFDPMAGVLRAAATNAEGHPRNQPDRRDPWLDITDTRVEFSLTAARAAGTIIVNGVAGIAPGDVAAFAPVNAVLTALDPPPVTAGNSDYPSTAFTLDMVLSGIELRPPFLKPAKMLADGLLVPDAAKPDVTFHLPKVKLRISQSSAANAGLDVALVSLGVAGLDDPGDLAAIEFVTMDPPYAFIGGDRTVGFAFRSAVLDLSAGFTPPAVLDQFGFDEGWTGLYLPEIRLFLAPNGMEDFAVNAGVRNLLIGLGQTPGVTGDFELMVINQGDGELALNVRFVGPDGNSTGVTSTGQGTADAAIPETARLLIDVSGGRAPYAKGANFDGADHPGAAHDISLAGAQQKTIVVTVADTSPGAPKSKTLTITAHRKVGQITLQPGGVGPAKPATVATTSVTLDGVAQSEPKLRLVSQTDDSVVVSLTTPNPATSWTVAGAPAGVSATVTIPVGGGETKSIRAEVAGATVSEIIGYFRFDQPPTGFDSGYSTNTENISASMATDPSASAPWTPPGRPFLDVHRETIKRIAAPAITIEGTASYEGDDAKAKYNYLLSRRRAESLKQLLDAQVSKPAPEKLPGFSATLLPAAISATADPPAAWVGLPNGWKSHTEPRNRWWKAVIKDFGGAALPGPVTQGEATRPTPDAVPPVVVNVPDVPPTEPDTPDWFRSAALKVRIIRDQFVAIELSGEVDFQTATEDRLAAASPPGTEMPTFQGLGSQNPADGIVKFQILYQTDPASQASELKLYLGADPADKDGLLMTGQLPGQALVDANAGRNMLGMITIFTPLLAETAPANPADGNVGAIVLSAAVVGLPFALAELGFFNIERVVLYGGELAVEEHGDLWQSTLLFDVETAISARIPPSGPTLIEIPREKPISVRYKAIGLKMGYPPGSNQRFELRPMFDQSKGYSIDLSGPGAIKVPDPLGQILQVLGARIARTNPLTFEIDLGFAFDLGVVTIERARVRVTIDQDENPPVGFELTAFAASISVPGVLEGRGYMEMNNNPFEMKGMIDVSLVPVKMRIAAGLAVAQIPESQGGPQTGVAISIEVNLPVAIPLANSGFGIYGFLGLFAMHYARDEEGINSLTPALTWLKERAGGNPTNLAAWKPNVDHWAFGVGAILGTMEGGIIFNMKGVVMLELPGPRLLLIMKANLLAVLPELKDANAEGTFLAVVDLDFGRGTLSIGFSIDFSIDPIVEIFIPIEAYFNLKKGGDWHVYLGTFPGNDLMGRPMPGPIHAKVLFVFDGSGYVMVSGHGIPAYKGLSSVNGVALAVGLEVGVLWGDTDINLYLRANAGFNAVLGFDPFYVGGILYARGELHLFIVSLSASAEITVQIGTRDDGTKVSRLDGEVCGEIDLFFFSIGGCVDFHIGEDGEIIPEAPALLKAVSLVSRSPALAVGTGVDRGIDASLGEALKQAAQPAANNPKLPVVPIDSIPVILMSATPVAAATLKILGEAPNGSTGAPSGGFVPRGDYAYRYEVTAVTLARADGGPVTQPGATPSTWWTRSDPADENLVTQLSLLNWTPFATPKAIERSEFLEELIKERWGTACADAAPAAAVLWTFEREPLGPSPIGWALEGEAWPDPPGGKRSGAPDLELDVDERWRSGVQEIDIARGIIPAIVEGRMVPCGDRPPPPLRIAGVPGATPFRARLAEEARLLRAATASSFGRVKAEALVDGAVDLVTARRMMETGQPVSRGALALAQTDQPPRATAPGERRCPARMLASPMFDYGDAVAFGDLTRRDEIAEKLKEIGWSQGPLDDVVVVHSGPIVEGRVLLYVRRSFLAKTEKGESDLVLRFLDAKGQEIDRRGVTFSDRLGVVPLPARWQNPAGPWAEEVGHVLGFGNLLQSQGFIPALVPLKKHKDLDRIEIGLVHRDPKLARAEDQQGRPYYLGAVELTRWGEVERQDWDESESKKNREVLEQFLGPASGDVALLFPDERYRVSATVTVKTKKPDGSVVDGAAQNESFWFRTDAHAPRRLDPWMLLSLPVEAETHVFGLEPLKFVFNTNDIDKLYGAYGKELRVRIKAASFAQVNEPGVAHPFPITVANGLEGVKGVIFSPFEGALVDLLSEIAPCVPVDVDRERHSAITIPIPLEPFTDYVIDIESVDIGAPMGTTGERVLRRNFSTGAFGSLDDFGLTFQGTATEHRFVAAGALQNIGTSFAAKAPEGAEFDNALIAAGLEPMPVPKAPRIVVFWESGPGGVPQPAAVLVDAPEPMRRTRPMPREVTTPGAPPTTRWQLVDTPWLTLNKASGSDDIVANTVFAPGRQRALVTLKSGARGKLLRLALVRKAFPEPWLDGPGATDTAMVVVSERFGHAPWEEI